MQNTESLETDTVRQSSLEIHLFHLAYQGQLSLPSLRGR